jgi:hypothetical protein
MALCVLVILIIAIVPFASESAQVSDNYPLAVTSDDESYPQIALDAHGYFHVIYTIADYELDISDIAYLKVDPNGTTLLGPKILSPSGLKSLNSEDICIDIDGMVHVVFDGYSLDGEKNVFYSKLNQDGDIVIDAITLASKDVNSQSPSIDTDRLGNAYIVWSTNEEPGQILWMKLSSTGTILIPPKNISQVSNDIEQVALPQIEVSNTGNSYIVWNQMNIIYTTWSIYYTSLTPDGLSIRGPLEIISNPIEDNWGVSSALDSNFNLHLTFMYSDPLNQFSIGYALVNDEGNLLKEERIDDPRPRGEAWWSHISIDPSDDVYIAYQRVADYKVGGWNIFLLIHRSDSDTWENRIQLSSNSSSQSTAIVAGYSHSGIVYELGHEDIYLVTVGPVVMNNPPIPILTSSTMTTYVDEMVLFNGSSSFDPDDGDFVYEYHFDWGDGSDSGWTTSSMNEHYYRSLGSYEVKLRIRDSRSLESNSPAIIKINVTTSNTNLPPISIITNPSDDEEFEDGNKIFINANESYDPDGDEITYEWFLDDQVDAIASGINGSLDLAPGLYQITLFVEDVNGATSSSSVTFTISDKSDPSTNHSLIEDNWIILIIIILSVLVVLFIIRFRKKEEPIDVEPL